MVKLKANKIFVKELRKKQSKEYRPNKKNM
jgi:hypothetical protein